MHYTRGVQKVRRLTVNYQIRTSYFVTFQHRHDTCNWNALGPAFLQCYDTVVEELLFLVFQPAYMPCNTNTNGEYITCELFRVA